MKNVQYSRFFVSLFLLSVRLTMDSLHQDLILEFRPDTLDAVRKLYNLDKPGRMKEAIDILEKWIKKQEHFTHKEFNRDYLERLIIRNKGLMERSKIKLDKICTTKTLLPQYFGLYNFKDDFEELQVMKDAVLPKMTSDHHRMYLVKNTGKEFSDTFVMNYFKKCIAISEYILKYDYGAGFIQIIDFTESNLVALLMKIELNFLRQMFDILMGGYGMRLKEMHLITTSKAIETFVTILKQILSKKLAERIFIHGSKESLMKAVEVDLLPEDYGGKEKPLDELHEQWLDVLSSKQHMNYLKMIHEVKTDESRRKLDKFNEHYFGTPGTFRTMIVD